MFYIEKDKDGPEKIDTIRFYVNVGGKPVSNEEIQTFDDLIDGKQALLFQLHLIFDIVEVEISNLINWIFFRV